MEKPEREALRQQLLARCQELTREIQRLRADLVCPADVGDTTTTEELIRLTDCELGRVISAMDDLAAGRYGQCIECEKKIAPARLAAIPGANRCCQCQNAVDSKTSRRFGSPRIPFYCPPQR